MIQSPAKRDHRGAPATGVAWRVAESKDSRVARQLSAHPFSLNAEASTVDQPQFDPARRGRRIDPVAEQFDHLAGWKAVQVEHVAELEDERIAHLKSFRNAM